jgi:hypothetical protein
MCAGDLIKDPGSGGARRESLGGGYGRRGPGPARGNGFNHSEHDWEDALTEQNNHPCRTQSGRIEAGVAAI